MAPHIREFFNNEFFSRDSFQESLEENLNQYHEFILTKASIWKLGGTYEIDHF